MTKVVDWQLTGVVVAILAVCVSVAIYFAQRVRKKLSIEIIHNGKLMTIKEEDTGKLQLVYDGTVIRGSRLIEARVTNTGNQPITVNDFVKPLVFSLNNGAVILTAAVIETEPRELPAGLEFDENTIEIVPLLLNPKDNFTIQLLVSGYVSGPEYQARIAGVSRITSVNERPYLVMTTLGLSYVCTLLAYYLGPNRLERVPYSWPEHAPAMFFIALSVLLVIWSFLSLYRKTKRRR